MTELLSNATWIVPVDDEDPRPWLGEWAAGNDQLLTFVHEATHHWCFQSPVVGAQIQLLARAEANALALLLLSDYHHHSSGLKPGSPRLKLGLAGDVLRMHAGDPWPGNSAEKRLARRELEEDVIDDLCRVSVIRELLRPLAEGLAMFAEFDAVSRMASSATSPIPPAVAFNFGGPDYWRDPPRLQPLGMLSLTAGLLYQARISPEGQLAKASLLVRPLSSTDGGYLPGYLAVKNMWRHLYLKDYRLHWESDLVLAYLRAFFFDDLALTAALLEAPSDAVQSVNGLIGAFQRRMLAFDDVTGDDVRVFEQRIASRDQNELDGHAGMRYSEHDYGIVLSRVKELTRTVLSGSRGGTISDWPATVATRQVQSLHSVQREFVTTCSVGVEAQTEPLSGELLVQWEGQRILRFAPHETVPDPSIEQPLRLDVIVGTFGREAVTRAAVVSCGKVPVACRTWGPNGDATRQWIMDEFASRENRLAASHLLGFATELVASNDLIVSMDRDRIMGSVPRIVDAMYRDKALWHARDHAAIDRCAALMAADGLRPVLGSLDLVRRTALLGLAASVDPRRETLSEVMHEHHHDLEDVLADLQGCWERHGFPPPVFGDDVLHPLI